MSYDSITVTQSSPHVGAEISNVDLLTPLSSKQVEEIRAALNAHGVVFFRNQKLDPKAHDRFVRYFGKPHVHAGGKSTASKPVAGYPALRKQYFDESSARISGETWHSDQSCAEIPPKYSVLYQEIIPPNSGGNTMFLSAAKAYEELFKKDQRDSRVAIEISEVFLLNEEYGKALRWADKAVSIDNKSGSY